MGYRLVSGMIRLLVRLFYRRVEVVGAERIPSRGPLIIAANHNNSLVDSMLILAIVPRRVTILVNAPLFRHPLVGPFLAMLGAVPVHRRAEAGDDPRKNEAMFAAVSAHLRAGGAILIFPEGRTQAVPTLLPLRTGAARIMLEAEAAGVPGVTLLPVGLVFEQPGTFRAASALVAIGEPVAAADCMVAHVSEPEAAVRRLTERLAQALRVQLVEAEDRYTLELVRALERAWWEEHGSPAPNAAASLAWRRQVMESAHALAERAPQRISEFRRRLELYRANLEASGLVDEELSLPYTPMRVVRWVAVNAASLGLTLPLAAWGILAHALPYWLTGVAVRALHRTDEEDATDKIAAGVVLYPVCWALEAWLVSHLAGAAAGIIFILALAPSGLIALAWRDRLARAARQVRAFGRAVVDRRLREDLVTERRALVEEAAALADLAKVHPG
jgi:glycerol-3-phosphate O-acyltransferase / dihydroxyacetone phosphate acyltransferase